MPETFQYVWCGLGDGANHISVPMCQAHCDSEQPPETVMVLPVFGEHECSICERDRPDDCVWPSEAYGPWHCHHWQSADLPCCWCESDEAEPDTCPARSAVTP